LLKVNVFSSRLYGAFQSWTIPLSQSPEESCAPLFSQCSSPQPSPTPKPPPPQSASAADQATYQQAHNSYDAQAEAFRATAKAALAAEGTHEAAFICPNVADPTEMNGCVAHENDITTTNYQAFATAPHSLLALPGPPALGLQATPASSAAAFDAAESTWQACTKTECDAEQAKWSDGNIVNFMGNECAIRQCRARLRELAEVYRLTGYLHR